MIYNLNYLLLIVVIIQITVSLSFEFPKIFGGGRKVDNNNNILGGFTNPTTKIQKQSILDSVSYTNNGKAASEEKQVEVLQKVRKLELDVPAPDTILTNDAQLLDGIWYLQYTSPSEVGNVDAFPDAWKPTNAAEDDGKITTKRVQSKGTINAAGITVDTSGENKIVQQIINVNKQTVTNKITYDWGQIQAGGKFRQSTTVPRRAIVAFDTAKIQFGQNDNSPTIDLGFIFTIVSFIRGTKDGGWLETTYIDEDMRIGRGNKGTMFILTRDPSAVKP